MPPTRLVAGRNPGPLRQMSERFDVIIIGSGIVGCSIALSLSRNGYKTLNVDALPAPGYGSTSHSSAIVRPYYSHSTSCGIAHEARARWLNWPEFLGVEDERGFARYSETGGLILIKQGSEHEHAASISAMEEIGVEYEWRSADDLAHQFDGIDLRSFGPPRLVNDPHFGQPSQGEIVGAIYIPACGYVSDPQLAAHNLYSAAAGRGAVFRFGCRVTELCIDPSGIRGIVTDSGESIDAPIVVNAAGPHSSKINEMAGLADALPITTRAERHEVAYTRAPHSGSQMNGFMADFDAGVYCRRDQHDWLVGSADPACDKRDVVDPDEYNDQFSEQWTTQLYRAGQRFPDLQIENQARGTVGLYDVSDDWIPIYDRTELDGYYLAIGTSGNQFKNAPIVGDILLAIIDGERSGANHDEQPAQLSLATVGRQVDLSFYSRLRENQSTSNVMA